ncbi:ABC transporter substrate-binding protein [Streptomyces sp. NPDC004237]|uniref:ABC transporter substrate-binding protein n=1 Tax=Streptomyces sp. NPDC004237 TaxID=3154455 RepID=UPI0033BCB141
MSRSVLITSAAVAIVLGLAGCSSSGASAGSSDNTSSASGDLPDVSSAIKEVKVDKTLAASIPQAIKQDGTLTVGSYLYYPPSIFLAKDGKTVVGNDNDLLQALGRKLDLKIKYQNMDFSALITSLKSQRIEVVMSAMSDTTERQKTVDFVDYLDSGIAIVVQKGNPPGITGPKDLCGKSVAVNTGTSQQLYAKQRSKECVADGQKALKVTVTDNAANNQTMLRTGRINALLTDLPTAGYMAATVENGKAFEVVKTDVINRDPYGIAVNKGNPELRDALAKALDELIKDGTYAQILKAWGVQNGAVKSAAINGAD